MLLYHPLYDAHHCVYRLLMLRRDCVISDLYWDQLKILDFYNLFPHFLSDIRLPRELISRRPLLRRIKKPYEDLPSSKRLVFELGEIQEQTAKSMVAKGIFDRDALVQGKIVVRENMIDKKLLSLIESNPFRDQEWYKFLTTELSLVPVFGADGLKDRTGLMEYRYDAV